MPELTSGIEMMMVYSVMLSRYTLPDVGRSNPYDKTDVEFDCVRASVLYWTVVLSYICMHQGHFWDFVTTTSGS